MKLYHGSNQRIDEIDLDKCRPFKDFGRGFYLTDIPEQAGKMAQRVARLYGGIPVVNEMQYKKLTSQYSFHTIKAISYLQKAGIVK